MNIEHLSVSRSQVFSECFFKYKQKYHLKVVSPEPTPIYFTYGSLIHNCGQEYVLQKGKKSITEISTEIFKNITLPVEYQKKIPIHLNAIQKLTQKIGFDGFTEYEFNHDLNPPNQFIVKGFIDRLIPKNNKFWIIDYKTTKHGFWRKNAKTIVTDLQLRTYARIVQKKFNIKAENIKAGLYYLEGEELLGVTFSENSLELVEKELLQTYLTIKSMHPDEAVGHVGNWCHFCEFKSICPFYKN